MKKKNASKNYLKITTINYIPFSFYKVGHELTSGYMFRKSLVLYTLTIGSFSILLTTDIPTDNCCENIS